MDEESEFAGAPHQEAVPQHAPINGRFRPSPAWPQERIDRARQCFGETLSASQTRKRLNDEFPHLKAVTRNAVIGKWHRLGLVGGPSKPGFGNRSAKKISENKRNWRKKIIRLDFGNRANPPPTRLPGFPAEPFVMSSVDELIIPIKDRRTLETLENHECRWPIGDPRKADFHFCGRKKIPGKSYCEFHALKAYRPPLPRHQPIDIAVPASQEQSEAHVCGSTLQSQP